MTPTNNGTVKLNRHKSFLKWAGSKFNCLNHVVSILPEGKRLIEPFAGSGVVFLNTSYSAYLLGEGNEDLTSIFTMLQNQGESFIHLCKSYFSQETNCNTNYYEFRTLFNQLPTSDEKSALFLYLNRHGYNGLCRYNSKGIFNVPFGRYNKPYFPEKEMVFFHQKSNNAHFINSDFRDTFQMALPGDVIYCDPPYVPILDGTKPFAYTQKRFDNEDHIELAELAQETAGRGIPVLISNHDTEFTRKHYKKAKIKSFLVNRWINCLSNQRKPAKELIALFKKK